MMEVECFSETLVTVRLHNITSPEDCTLNIHCRENLKYHMGAHHVLNREEGVNVQSIPPPVAGAADMVCSRGLKHRVVVEPLHCYLHNTKHKQVWHSQPAVQRPDTKL